MQLEGLAIGREFKMVINRLEVSLPVVISGKIFLLLLAEASPNHMNKSFKSTCVNSYNTDSSNTVLHGYSSLPVVQTPRGALVLSRAGSGGGRPVSVHGACDGEFLPSDGALGVNPREQRASLLPSVSRNHWSRGV